MWATMYSSKTTWGNGDGAGIKFLIIERRNGGKGEQILEDHE